MLRLRILKIKPIYGTDDEAKARRITDDYEKARYSNGEVSEEDISFLKNFK